MVALAATRTDHARCRFAEGRGPQSRRATDLPETNPGSDRDPAGVTSHASSDDWCRASVEAHERRGARINREPTDSV